MDSAIAEQVMDLLHPRDWNNWTVVQDGIYFVERKPDQKTFISFFSFEEGKVIERTAPSGWIGEDLAGGLTALRTGMSRRIFYAQVDRDESDIVLVEGFH